MNVLLIDTGYNTYELDEPLGIEQLDACITNELKNTIILTTVWLVAEPEFVLQDIYDIVLISSNIYNNGKTEEVVNYFNNSTKNPPIIIGGVAPTLSPEQILKKYNKVICVIGEGEDTIIELLKIYIYNNDGINNNFFLYNVPNIAFLNEKKEIVKTKRKAIDLNEIKYLPNRKYLEHIIENNGLIRIESSRGCDWNRCTFCIIPWKYANCKRREYNISRLMLDIEKLISYNVSKVYFTDEEFFSYNLEKMKEKLQVLKTYRDIKPGLQFIASTSVRLVQRIYKLDSDFWKYAKSCGIFKLFIGIESFSDTQLKRYCKGNTFEESINSLSILHDSGIETDVGFIMFDPFVTVEELKQNTNRIIESNFITTTARLTKKLRVTNNTVFYDILKETGLIKDFDSNGMEYVWDFLDPNICSVFQKITQLENEQIETSYYLQSKCRGNITDDSYDLLNDLRKELIYSLQEYL